LTHPLDEEDGSPSLSVIVTLASDSIIQKYDQTYLRKCLDSLQAQDNAPSHEIIVPFPSIIREFKKLEDSYHSVCFLPVNDPRANSGPGPIHEHFDILRANGLSQAQGKIISLVEDQEIMDRHWAAKITAAHSQEYAVVGGTVENGINKPINWAVYFCDFLQYQIPIRASETSTASDVNVSYKREALEAVRRTWQDGFHEPAVHREIIKRGWKIGIEPEAIAYQMRTGLDFRSVLKERFIWGRHYAAQRQRDFPKWKALVYSVFSAFLPLILLFRKTHTIIKKRRNIGIYFSVLPLTFVLIIFWSAGEMVGYITGRQ
jgi:hypothetical protein